MGDRLRQDSEPVFVGRESALRALDDAFGHSHLLTLQAPAGGGKSRLLRQWTRGMKARVLWAKAERGIAPNPFGMLAGPIADLDQEVTGRPDLATFLGHELGVQLPLLQSLRGRRRSPGLQRGILVMLSLMLTVLGRDQPTLLVLDDCQWADPLTLRFLEYWSENGADLLVVAIFRGEEVTPEHPLAGLLAPTLILPPLSPEQAHQLLLSRRPEATLEARERVVRQACGNPFSLLCMIREESDFTPFESLPESLRKALGLAAVLGREFSHEALAACHDGPLDLALAFHQGLLEASAGGCQFAHDRLRDAMLASLHADVLSAYHLKIARYLAKIEQDNAFETAFHYQAAGQLEEGFVYAQRAAQLALEGSDSSTAAFYLKAALGGCKDSEESRETLLVQLGDCYRLTGLYKDALDCLAQAFLLARTDVARAKLMQCIGDVHFKRGELELARTAVERGLALLGERPPRWVAPAFLRGAVVQLAHTCFPRWFLDKPGRQEPAQALLCVDLYNRLAYIRWFLDGPIPSICAHLRELNLAERYPPSRSLARARANHAMAMAAFPAWGRSLRFGESAVRTAKSLDDDWGQGQAAHFYGAALLGASRLVLAREQLEDAVRRLRQTGDRWEENGARYHLAQVYYHQGELEKAACLAQETHEIGVQIEDRLAAGDNLFTWARASGGLIPQGPLEKEKAISNPDIHRACELLAAEGLVELRQQRYDIAHGLFEKAIALYRSRRAQTMYSASLPCWSLTALRLWGQSTALGPNRTFRLAQAESLSKRSLALARKYRNNLPHTLREQALVLALRGKTKQARSALEESLRVAVELGMSAELRLGALCRSRCGLLESLPSRPEAEDSQRHAWLLGGLDVPETIC